MHSLYFRFCKNAIFQNFGNIIFFRWFAFFFSGQLFSAVSQPICTKFWMNTSSCMRFILSRANCEKLKKPKIGQFFAPVVTFSLVVTKRLNFFEKSLLWWHLECCTFLKMYLWWFRTVWFSQSLSLMERQKRPILRSNILQTVWDTAKVCMKYR